MKKSLLLSFVLILGSFFLCLNSYSQITRGAQPGELYISTDWYMDEYGQVHYAILHSTDNGETVSLKYENIENTPPGEMRVGNVLGDATPGVVYNYRYNKLWVSFDYGVDWEFIENYPDNTYYLTGLLNGIIYKTSWIKLHRSENFGQSFEIITDPLTIPIPTIGFFDGEFYGINGDAGVGFKLVHTTDYANTYSENPIDSAVAFWSISGYWPNLSRGTESNELYLTSWWPVDYYKIYHSVDTGYTWTEKFESETINVYFWRVKYTAGREPGSFYVMRSRINPAGDHTWLYIDYSNDYGETFTTYFHDLDSTITNVSPVKSNNLEFTNIPNPVKTETTFQFRLPEGCSNPVLNIYNTYGNLIRHLNITGENSQIWDGKDNAGNRLKEGLYLYNISYDNFSSQFNKLLILN